jgi:hypothetical protein
LDELIDVLSNFKYIVLKSIKSLFIFLLSAFVFTLFSSFNFSNSEGWVLQKNESGIAVYTREREGSAIKEVRVVNKVRASLSSIVALMLETTNYPSWIYGCVESSPLKVVNEKEMYNYQVTDLPWPLTDRDVICHFTISQDTSSGIITMTKTAVPEFIPEKKSMVRLHHYDSEYRLIPLAHDSVRVELELSIDPGGNLPAWMININLVTGPFKTTEAMIKQLPRYQQMAYSFIREK